MKANHVSVTVQQLVCRSAQGCSRQSPDELCRPHVAMSFFKKSTTPGCSRRIEQRQRSHQSASGASTSLTDFYSLPPATTTNNGSSAAATAQAQRREVNAREKTPPNTLEIPLSGSAAEP